MGMVGLLQMRPIPSHQNKGSRCRELIGAMMNEVESLCSFLLKQE